MVALAASGLSHVPQPQSAAVAAVGSPVSPCQDSVHIRAGLQYLRPAGINLFTR